MYQTFMTKSYPLKKPTPSTVKGIFVEPLKPKLFGGRVYITSRFVIEGKCLYADYPNLPLESKKDLPTGARSISIYRSIWGTYRVKFKYRSVIGNKFFNA